MSILNHRNRDVLSGGGGRPRDTISFFCQENPTAHNFPLKKMNVVKRDNALDIW